MVGSRVNLLTREMVQPKAVGRPPYRKSRLIYCSWIELEKFCGVQFASPKASSESYTSCINSEK